MKDTTHFFLQFNFAGRQTVVSVTSMLGADATQYTLRPESEDLAIRYGTQILHIYPGKDRPIVFHFKNEERLAFWDAVGVALRRELQIRHNAGASDQSLLKKMQ